MSNVASTGSPAERRVSGGLKGFTQDENSLQTVQASTLDLVGPLC
jgi:hypothetical protein